MDHEIDFENGHLFCQSAQEGDEEDLYSTLEIFERMKKYYESYCIVRHWKQLTLESGGYVESRTTVKSAIWMMKEGWFERASFTVEVE